MYACMHDYFYMKNRHKVFELKINYIYNLSLNLQFRLQSQTFLRFIIIIILYFQLQ